jgi:cold shock protein
MKRGTVKFFNEVKKFGFIACPDDGKEYYVHIKDISEPLKEGDTVTFDLQEMKRGPQAVNVKKA